MAVAPRRTRRGRGCFVAFLFVSVASLGAGAYLYQRARYIPPEVPVDTSPQAVVQAEERVEQAVETIEQAREDAAAGRERPYHVEVREEDINTVLRTDDRVKRLLKKHNVERPRVEVEDGRLKAGGLVTYQGRQVYVTAEGSVERAEDGRMTFRPEQVWLGKVAAPTALTEEVARRVAEAFESGELTLPGQVESVRLEDGRLVIEGRTR